MTINDAKILIVCVILITTVSIFITKLVSSKIYFRIQHNITQFLHITKIVFLMKSLIKWHMVTEHEEFSLNSPVYTVPGSRFFPVLL